MFTSWTFGRMLAAGFAIAGVVLLVLALVGYRTAGSLLEDQARVVQTHEVRGEITRLLSSVADAETGQRGYVITRDDSYLAPYDTALVDIARRRAALRALVSDNPAQLRRLAAAEKALDAKLAELERPIAARRDRSFEAAQAIVDSDVGHALMIDIRRSLTEMDHEETAALATRIQTAERSAVWTQRAMSWGGAGALLLFALLAWFTIREVSRRIGVTVAQMRSASAELEASANQQVSSARESESAMAQISSTFDELLTTSRSIAVEAQAMSSAADDTAVAGTSGRETLDETEDSFSAMRQQIDLVVRHTAELGTRSRQIDALLRLVELIAKQTNILAVNATLEAAEAQGERFVLVADEIRKLADRVASATKNIRASVESVQASLASTTVATAAGDGAVLEGVEAFERVTRSFSEIHQLVGVTRDSAREIELLTKQQTTAVAQVHLATDSVGQTTREHLVSSKETLRTASELQKLAADLQKIIDSNAEIPLATGRRPQRGALTSRAPRQ